MEVLEQAVKDFQAQQGQQGEYVLEFEARLEGMFQKFDNKIASHAQTSVRSIRWRRNILAKFYFSRHKCRWTS